jgi:hypothetical protein
MHLFVGGQLPLIFMLCFLQTTINEVAPDWGLKCLGYVISMSLSFLISVLYTRLVCQVLRIECRERNSCRRV